MPARTRVHEADRVAREPGARGYPHLARVGHGEARACLGELALSEAASDFDHLPAGDIRITGCDGLPNYGQRLVLERRLAATVIVPATAGVAVDRVIDAVESDQTPTSDVVLDVQSFPELDALREHARELLR